MQSDIEMAVDRKEPVDIPEINENAMYLINSVTRQELPLKRIQFEGDAYASRFCRILMM